MEERGRGGGGEVEGRWIKRRSEIAAGQLSARLHTAHLWTEVRDALVEIIIIVPTAQMDSLQIYFTVN